MKRNFKATKEYIQAASTFVLTIILCIILIILNSYNDKIWLSVICTVMIIVNTALILLRNLKLKRLKDLIEGLAHTDALTGISNRRFFIEFAAAQIDRTVRLNKECFIIMFDIDNFKSINDKYGHSVGDEILKLVCQRIKREIRPYDLFARYGGEEFILLICDAEYKSVINLAERLRNGIEEIVYGRNGEKIMTTASFGVARYSSEYTLDEIIVFADKALYCSKNNGKNAVKFYNEDND